MRLGLVFQHLVEPLCSLQNVITNDILAAMPASENVIRDAISPAQLRAARALLGWTQDQLATASDLPKRTIARLELGESSSPQQRTLAAIRAAIEMAGVIFVDENGDGAGVRLRKA